jgi:ACR3 family arsenite efflux pump ArsB
MILRKSLAPLFALLVAVNAIAVIFRKGLEHIGYDINVLLLGNLLICIITAISFVMLYRGMRATDSFSFLRSVYGSFVIKLILVAGIVFGYAFVFRSGINKMSLFTCMFLYLIYTFLEMQALMRVFRKRKNG